MAPARLLLVDDDELVRSGLKSVFEAYEFDVTVASSVVEALCHIVDQSFDVLLCDLHMPGPGDGLTVVSAMRHSNPDSVAIILSAYPDMAKAAEAVLAQANEVLVKPMTASAIVRVIRGHLARPETPRPPIVIEDIADLLERESEAASDAWLAQVLCERELTKVPLTADQRCEHIANSIKDVVFRLRYPQPLGSVALFSMSALQHGVRRRRQGYGPAMMVQETRILQVALFQKISQNIDRIDFSAITDSLMTIADELNSQLLQSLSSYENELPA